jgi:hypothetical protein
MRSRKQTTKLAMGRADTPTTQECPQIEITNGDNDHHFLRFHSTKPANVAYYVEILKQLRDSVLRRRPKIWPNDWILHHDNSQLTRRSLSSYFWTKKSTNEMEHQPYSA